jgi:hypothetical protein
MDTDANFVNNIVAVEILPFSSQKMVCLKSALHTNAALPNASYPIFL